MSESFEELLEEDIHASGLEESSLGQDAERDENGNREADAGCGRPSTSGATEPPTRCSQQRSGLK